MKIGFAITGSFCTHAEILKEIENLSKKYDILPIISDSVKFTDTRFGNANDFIKSFELICGKKVVSDLVSAEPIGPNNMIDILVIAPCTGNTLSKLANGISDNAVTIAAKAHMRNYKPIVIGISSNDALGFNLKNIGTLLNSKNIYFVPFGQDNAKKKPKSLISDYSLIDKTIDEAINGRQIQPLLIKK